MEHVTDSIDVLVIGGGTAGTIAAIQASRLGERTALVESGSQLGGVTTTGGVSFPHQNSEDPMKNPGFRFEKCEVLYEKGKTSYCLTTCLSCRERQTRDE